MYNFVIDNFFYSKFRPDIYFKGTHATTYLIFKEYNRCILEYSQITMDMHDVSIRSVFHH